MLTTLLFSGLVIGSNNLAAALAIGTLGRQARRWRVLLVFGVFEFGMPLVGYWIGEQASTLVGEAASALSVLILLGLAGVAFYAATRPASTDEKMARRLTTWKGLVVLELGLSLDNLVAGFSLGLRPGELSPLLLAAAIAAFSVFYTWLGMWAGGKLAARWQNYAEACAGVLLCALAGMSWFGVI
ncbi:manganese efflux pump MntP [Pontibacter pamirensis]|uniref:manganese efflux pump MntP n=1 Tax=Pontibacter pamirensis TaxID=2562824 RepID=UPI001389C3FF|nr:manganese efflux pump [Pontibacter pamirensis]